MKKTLFKFALSALTLVSLSTSAYAAVGESCDGLKPTTGGSWNDFCSCFVDHAIKACNAKCPMTRRPCTKSTIDYDIKYRATSDTIIKSSCGRQIAKGSTCVPPGTTPSSCLKDVTDYKKHCLS